jgi:hypothetical protein
VAAEAMVSDKVMVKATRAKGKRETTIGRKDADEYVEPAKEIGSAAGFSPPTDDKACSMLADAHCRKCFEAALKENVIIIVASNLADKETKIFSLCARNGYQMEVIITNIFVLLKLADKLYFIFKTRSSQDESLRFLH